MADSVSPQHHVPADLPDRIRHYIDGAFVDSVDGATFDVMADAVGQVSRYVVLWRHAVGHGNPPV